MSKMSNLVTKDNSLFQEVSVYEEQKLTGGNYLRYLEDLVDVDINFDLDVSLDIVNIIAIGGSLMAIDDSNILGGAGDINIKVG